MKYPNLRLISKIYRLLGYLVLGISSIVAAIFLLSRIGYDFIGGFVMAFLALLGGLILSISQLAIAEGIAAFIDLVENSHIQRKLAEDMHKHTLGVKPPTTPTRGKIIDPFS